MIQSVRLMAIAGFLFASTAYANAAAVPTSGSTAFLGAEIAAKSGSNVIQAHGRHRKCRRGRAGWHRHIWRRGERIRIRCYPYDERRERRRHRYYDDCVKLGPVRVCPED